MTLAVPTSPAASRVLGAGGVIAGTVLLLGFLGLVVEFAPGMNEAKLVLYCLGSIGCVIGAYGRVRPTAGPRFGAAAIAAVVANAWYIVKILLPYGPWHPFVGIDGTAWFIAGIALWSADAAFGIVCYRSGGIARLGGAALAVG